MPWDSNAEDMDEDLGQDSTFTTKFRVPAKAEENMRNRVANAYSLGRACEIGWITLIPVVELMECKS